MSATPTEIPTGTTTEIPTGSPTETAEKPKTPNTPKVFEKTQAIETSTHDMIFKAADVEKNPERMAITGSEPTEIPTGAPSEISSELASEIPTGSPTETPEKPKTPNKVFEKKGYRNINS